MSSCETSARAARVLPPRRFRLRLTRTYDPRFLKKTEICQLRLPVPLEESALTDLSVVLSAPKAHEIIRCSRTAGRLDVTVDPDKVSELTSAATCEFVCHPHRSSSEVVLNDREEALALGPSEGLIRLTPAVRELAEQLLGGETDTMTIVRLFWDYLHAALNTGALRYAQLNPADPLISILNIGWADCQLASALLVALCRSRELPARIVSGFMLQHTRPGDRSPWRDIFFGRIDYRACVECLPHLFTGLPGFQLPVAWHLNVSRIEGGTRTCLEDSSNGEAVFSDDVSCERLR